ncbi:GGDEF domain-containing protein [Thiohalocapsa sp. ML1]|uniref:GGDEF domain-containing protein n=1 Tax=Thiohalocapsa sp. ML1 TaxID=1431688 RepID=UPI000731F3FB|nr:GGDEF domain-containing protein [Thiohalocapsa sp. ML1]
MIDPDPPERPGSLAGTLHDADLIPPLLRHLSAVAVAVLDLDGRCLDANRGFAYLLDRDAPPAAPESVAHWFQQPSFHALRDATADGEPFTGCLSFGDGASFLRSVQGEVRRRDDRLLLLAEHDIAELERLSATVLQLNERLAKAQRELVRANRALERDKAEIRRLMLTDPLTGAANRRAFDARCSEALARDDARLGFIVADIDHFKSVNDSYGHAVGDVALIAFVTVLHANTRGDDMVARLGGEEFCVVLPDNGLEHSLAVAERIRRAFHETDVEGIDRRLSASFGVACRRPGQGLDDLLREADAALYRAKAEGRNRVVAADAPGR